MCAGIVHVEARMNIRNIVIFGTGRCGSTLLQEILSYHPEVAWLSEYAGRNPNNPQINRFLLSLLSIPLVGRLLRRHRPPTECYDFWEHYIPGFRRSFRDLREDDLLESHKAICSALDQTRTRQRRIMLLKITGWPRLGLLHSLLPDSLFVHVIRDGRAVAASTLKVPFWRGWGGPTQWRWGRLPKDYDIEWHRWNKSYLALAGIQWKILMDAAEQAVQTVPEEKVLTIRYEDLCKDTDETLQPIMRTVGIAQRTISNLNPNINIHNANYKWKDEFSGRQQDILLDVLGEHLRKYGYID